jgi:DNA helicase-2/ATP-dependent DNA helicase PcrA
VFYKILLGNKLKDGGLSVPSLILLNPIRKRITEGKAGEGPADITTVTQQINLAKIQDQQFYKGCEEDCHWCNFVKTNNLAIALHEEGETKTSWN